MNEKIYICPMHPEIMTEKPGRCPKCGMELILKEDIRSSNKMNKRSVNEIESPHSYRPLYIIISLIFLVVFIVSFKDINNDNFSFEKSMSYFMGGFFLIFSGFKLLDLKGFAQGYYSYDLLAKNFFQYGYIYPFIEFALGILYLLQYNSLYLNLLTFILMSFSGTGVLIKLLKHEKFQCVCLGTFLKVPLTKVTLIEDFGMAAMALLMIFL